MKVHFDKNWLPRTHHRQLYVWPFGWSFALDRHKLLKFNLRFCITFNFRQFEESFKFMEKVSCKLIYIRALYWKHVLRSFSVKYISSTLYLKIVWLFTSQTIPTFIHDVLFLRTLTSNNKVSLKQHLVEN